MLLGQPIEKSWHALARRISQVKPVKGFDDDAEQCNRISQSIKDRLSKTVSKARRRARNNTLVRMDDKLYKTVFKERQQLLRGSSERKESE